MTIVIQWAARKRPGAELLFPQAGNESFSSRGRSSPPPPTNMPARMTSPTGVPSRNELLSYNETEEANNPLGLYLSYRHYDNLAYERLVERFGLHSVYILSAGWGLIRADFLTPYYDITFSRKAEVYKRRRPTDPYHDFRMPSDDTKDEVVFFGGQDYLPLFSSLTECVGSRRTVFYNSVRCPRLRGCALRFETSTRTNWHYECANAFPAGAIGTD